MSEQSGKEQVQVNFRMPLALREKLGTAAYENRRSVNAEIVARLEQTFEGRFVSNGTYEAYYYQSLLLQEIDDLRKDMARLSEKLKSSEKR